MMSLPMWFVGLIGLLGVLLAYSAYEVFRFRQEASQRMMEICDLLRQILQKS